MSDPAIDIVRRHALPLDPVPGLHQVIDLIGDARLVLLGEASHGTHEFYRVRADITRELVAHHGFNLVAVEADWPDAYRACRWTTPAGADATAEEALADFTRFPRWMWRNTVVVDFLRWLREWNAGRPPQAGAAFYGLDLYSLRASMEAVVGYLDRVDPVEANRARVRAAKYVIVVPLPYQGDLRPYATSILRGAQLAVDLERGAGSDLSVVLAARDYGGDVARLGAVLDETCREARCVGIVGPVLSREATAVAPRAASLKIPAVSPTATGPMPQNRYLFRAALTAKAEGAAAARYAVEHLGLKRFVVLAPRDRYSQDVAAMFAEEVARQEARVVFSSTYEPGAVDFGHEIKALKEADLKQEGVLESLPAEAGAPDAPPKEPVYVPGFDAVFLPGDAETVGLIAAQLRFYDVVAPLLGASGWNDRAVMKNGGKYVEDAIFADAFFADSQDAAVQRFVKQYRARYRVAPDVFAALAYDATATLVQGLKNGATNGDRLREELTRMAGYSGVSGLTGFGPDGDAQRRLSWIQIRNGRFVPAL